MALETYSPLCYSLLIYAWIRLHCLILLQSKKSKNSTSTLLPKNQDLFKRGSVQSEGLSEVIKPMPKDTGIYSPHPVLHFLGIHILFTFWSKMFVLSFHNITRRLCCWQNYRNHHQNSCEENKMDIHNGAVSLPLLSVESGPKTILRTFFSKHNALLLHNS